ncbi:MAG: AAA family ATPase [Pseudonocardia sp.]
MNVARDHSDRGRGVSGRRPTEAGPRRARPDTLYPITSTPANTGDRANPWTLTGREAECRTILDALVADVARSVIVFGAPGVGRTRLAREALARARDAGRETRWATGTVAASAVPLGAMAHLVPPTDAAQNPFTLLQRAMSAIDAAGHGHPLVVGIDDAHLLDELSVMLVQHLAISSSVSFVLTMRPGLPVANQLAALWKDGVATRLELQPLVRGHSDRLVATMLGGNIDTRTGERLWRLSRGHPLFLRELVAGGRAGGHLHLQDGLWRWDGEMCSPSRLVEIVLAELDSVGPRERAVLQTIAISDPLRLEPLDGSGTSDAVAALERRGFVTLHRAGRRAEARVAHPLYAEVVRAEVPGAIASLIQRELACEVTRHPSREGLLRVGRMAVDSARTGLDAGLLTEAAGHANAVLDHVLAERLALAAVNVGGGVSGHLALLEAVHWRGRHAEAERIAVALARGVASDDDRSRLAMLRAVNLFRGLGRATDAESTLAAAEGVVTDDGARNLLLATRALLAFESGRPRDAVELGTGIGQGGRSLAAAAVASGLAMIGRTADALTAVETGWAALADTPTEPGATFARLALARGELLALSVAGRFAELGSRAVELHERGMAGPQWAGDAVSALHRGWAALESGHLRGAVRWLTEALAGFRRQDPAGLLAQCAAQLAQARALLGDGRIAKELLTGTASTRLPATVVFEPQMLLAQAWQAATEVPGSAALAGAREAARIAADRGMRAAEATALHAVALLGKAGEVAARLHQLAGLIDGRLAVLFAEHAEGLVAGSGRRLDEVAAGFEDVGALLPAADAAASAALAHHRAGDRRAASASTAMATNLGRACGGARTPALDRLTSSRRIAREVEVADRPGRGPMLPRPRGPA